MHVAGGNDSDASTALSQSKCDVQRPVGVGHTQRVKTRLGVGVFRILKYQQRLIEKDFFSLELTHTVLVILALITTVPFEAGDFRALDHACILRSYTSMASALSAPIVDNHTL